MSLLYIYYSQNLNLTIIFYRCHLYTSFKLPYVGLQCVIVVHVFPDHTHLLFHMLLVFSCCVFVVVFLYNFVESDHGIFFTAILLPSADSRRVAVSFKPKYVHEVLVYCLVKHAQEKVWFT